MISNETIELPPIDIYPFQYDFLMDQTPTYLLSGGSGIGKTYIAGLKTVKYMLEHPGCLGLIGSSTWDNTIKIMVSCIEEWLDAFPYKVGEWLAGHNTIRFINGSKIFVKNLQKAGRLKGPNIDFIWVDEGTEIHECQSIIEQLENRLRSKHSKYPKQLVITTNPDLMTHYLYQRFWLNKMTHISGEEVFYPPEENLGVSLSAYEGGGHLNEDFYRRLKTLSPHRRKMLLEGIWGTLEGQAFFLEKGLHIQEFQPDRSWKFFLAYDYGFNPDPMVYLLVGLWQNRFYIIDEINFLNVLVGPAQVTLLKKFTKGYPISGFTGDPTHPGTVKFLKKDMKYKFYPTNNERYDGWIKLCDYFDQFYEDTRTTGITIHPRCRKTIESVTSLEWDENKRDIQPGNDHHADALRYLTMSRISKGVFTSKSEIRSMYIKGLKDGKSRGFGLSTQALERLGTIRR